MTLQSSGAISMSEIRTEIGTSGAISMSDLYRVNTSSEFPTEKEITDAIIEFIQEQTFTITVNPTAQVNDPQDQIICNTDTTSVEFTTENTGGTTTYAWTNDTTSIGLADLGTGNIPSFSGVNTGTSPITANLTVTPTFTENGVSCTGPTETFTITVNPTGQVDPIQD